MVGDKGQREWKKSHHLDLATLILLFQKPAVFSGGHQNILDFLIYIFYIYRDKIFFIYSMDAFLGKYFHFTLPDDQGIQEIPT